jgi:CHAT domain-containing protein
MLIGAYSRQPHGGDRPLPHVVMVSITRAGAGNDLLVSIHEEGTALSWSQVVGFDRDTEASVITSVAALHEWSLGKSALTQKRARALAERLGRTLYRTFIGRRGTDVLRRVEPTALMLAVDEALLSLPWELMPGPDGAWLFDVPIGRIVTTGIVPTPGRDPKVEDPLVKILAVANPTGDLPATEAELDAITALQGAHGDVTVDVTVIPAAEATCAAFRNAVAGTDFDVIHVAGHAAFSPADPGRSALRFRDGPLAADEVPSLKWAAPPYIVFNSACESARAARGRRLVSKGHRNGLAAAFLAAGAEAYLGHFWPVDDDGAATFASTFYKALIDRVNVGSAVLEARRAVHSDLVDRGRLTALGAVFFGDAGSAERRDVAMAN